MAIKAAKPSQERRAEFNTIINADGHVKGALEVAATGVLTFTGAAIADQTVTIGTVVYTWKSSVSGTATATAVQVKIGADQDASATNLSRAINLSGGTIGTDYQTGTVAHPKVSAVVDTGANTVTLTALDKGAAGNAVVTTETGTNTAFGAATLASGADSASYFTVVEIAGMLGVVHTAVRRWFEIDQPDALAAIE